MARLSMPFNGERKREHERFHECLLVLCFLFSVSDETAFGGCYENATVAASTGELYFDYKSSVVENGMCVFLYFLLFLSCCWPTMCDTTACMLVSLLQQHMFISLQFTVVC